MYNWKTVLITIIALVGIKIWSPYLIDNVRWSYFDVLHQQKEKVIVDDILLVNIDEKAIEKYGQYPFPRDIYADTLWETHHSNTHVFNILFAEEDRFGGDEVFAEALENRLTILSSAPTIQKESGNAPFVNTSVFGDGNIQDHVWNFSGLVSPRTELQNSAWGMGVTVATPPVANTPNFDGTNRAIPLVIQANGQLYPSLGFEVLRAYYDQPNYQTRVTADAGIEWVKMGRDKPIETTSSADLMISYWNEFESISFADLQDSDIEGKILVYGLTAEGLSIPVSTPMGVMYPHEVQAHLIQTVSSGVQIHVSETLEMLETFLLLLVLLGILVSVYKLPTAFSAIVSVGFVLLQVGLSHYLWFYNLVLFDIFWSSLSSVVVFGHASFNQYYTTYQLKEQIKKQFQKYLSPDMIEELQKDPSKLRLGGDRREMTFMFMDIIGFTPISEHYMQKDDPEGLVELINKFLDMQTKIILNNSVTIDKYMGDCIMSFWNAPLDCENHADLAVKSALEVLDATKELNEELKPLNLPPINVGIGISSGECIVGNMGSELRFDYSVIGDAVNLGARLEGQTRNYNGVDLLLSERTYQLCPDRAFTRVDRITVKGKSEQVTIYTI
jgi:adenylate cyclase